MGHKQFILCVLRKKETKIEQHIMYKCYVMKNQVIETTIKMSI